MMNEDRIEKLKDIIKLLEDVRDGALAAGQGPFMSDDLFNRIDELYIELMKALGHYPSDPTDDTPGN